MMELKLENQACPSRLAVLLEASDDGVDEAIAQTIQLIKQVANSLKARRSSVPCLVAGATVRVPKGILLPEAILIVDALVNRDLVAQMALELAPVLLEQLQCPGYCKLNLTEWTELRPLRQLWLPNDTHLDMLHHLAFAYTWTKHSGVDQKTLNALGRACSWLFRESQRPGQQVVLLASQVLRELFTFPTETVRQNHLGYLLAWLETRGGYEARLAAATEAEQSSTSTSLEQFSYIALLQPEVINRCQENVEQAKALLGLVVRYIAPNDSAWRQSRVVAARRSGQNTKITVWGALWLSDLLFRSWVPFADDEGNVVKSMANATTLQPLLDPAWLEQNDAGIELLSRHFGFDELDLRLLGVAPDLEQRQVLRNGIAKLVETCGADPAVYASVAQEMIARKRQESEINCCRQLGLAVQDAIEAALRHHGVEPTLVDRGFDLLVDVPMDNTLEDVAARISLYGQLLEVKATTTGRACITPMQVQTACAESHRYSLCVVDLRGIGAEFLSEEWTRERVEPLAKVLSTIGSKVKETYVLVEDAAKSTVPIRNEKSLRYEVPVGVWERGVSIADWVREITAAALSRSDENGTPRLR